MFETVLVEEAVETTNLIVLDGIGFGVYDNGRWEIVFRVLDDRFIEVVGSRIEG